MFLKKLWLLFLFCPVALGQYFPPISIVAQNPSGQMVYVAMDVSGNLFTNGTGSGVLATTVPGYVPPMAMTAQSPSGAQVYLKADANGNLLTNCSTGCSGGGGGGNQTVTTITAGATPAITAGNGLWTITMNSDTAPTISGIAAGQRMTFQICQPGAGGPYNWTWPAAIHGGMAQVTRNASQCSQQSFDSWSGTTLVSENAGATNVAP